MAASLTIGIGGKNVAYCDELFRINRQPGMFLFLFRNNRIPELYLCRHGAVSFVNDKMITLRQVSGSFFEQVVNIGPDEPDVGKAGIKEDTVFLSYFNQSNRIFNFGNKQRFGQICIAEHYFELLWRFINTAKSPDIF